MVEFDPYFEALAFIACLDIVAEFATMLENLVGNKPYLSLCFELVESCFCLSPTVFLGPA